MALAQGLGQWTDGVVGELFRLLAMLKDTPDPVTVLEGLLTEPMPKFAPVHGAHAPPVRVRHVEERKGIELLSRRLDRSRPPLAGY